MDVIRHFPAQPDVPAARAGCHRQPDRGAPRDYLSALADLILRETLVECWSEMPVRHVETPRFAVIAYWKAGRQGAGL
jgi:glutamate-ammonia-ligase adenylyltransferase